jgi:hypothetical protein
MLTVDLRMFPKWWNDYCICLAYVCTVLHGNDTTKLQIFSSYCFVKVDILSHCATVTQRLRLMNEEKKLHGMHSHH